MKEEDLIRQLESLETPDIELSGHRQALRTALLRSDRFQRRSAMGWARMLAPVAAAVALMMVLGFFNLVQPRLQIAQAEEIARSDPQVQALLEEHGLDIAEVKLENGQAFVLLAAASINPLASESAAYPRDAGSWLQRILDWPYPTKTNEEGAGNLALAPSESEPFRTYVLKVDLTGKEVSGLCELDEATTLLDINLDEIDFADFESSVAPSPEETDPEEEDRGLTAPV